MPVLLTGANIEIDFFNSAQTLRRRAAVRSAHGIHLDVVLSVSGLSLRFYGTSVVV
jgi:hypothetical protein